MKRIYLVDVVVGLMQLLLFVGCVIPSMRLRPWLEDECGFSRFLALSIITLISMVLWAVLFFWIMVGDR